MSDLNEINTWLRERLPGPAEYKVPGVAVAVSAGGQVIDVAAGVLSTATGVGATADSVFQVGSITKVWTATLLMQLVDEGQLDLDAPVQRYLPEFGLADPDAAAAITVRQLMCHTAGFEGDLFTDTGRGDDCVEKYVRTLVGVTQLFPPGEMFFYNNAGSCVLGRVVEVLRGKPFDACMREHLFTPLGLTHVANGADEAILFRAAVGHISPTPPRSRPSSGWRRWPVRRWAGRRTATSPPASARRPWTGWAPWAAERTRTTSTFSWASCPAGRPCSRRCWRACGATRAGPRPPTGRRFPVVANHDELR